MEPPRCPGHVTGSRRPPRQSWPPASSPPSSESPRPRCPDSPARPPPGPHAPPGPAPRAQRVPRLSRACSRGARPCSAAPLTSLSRHVRLTGTAWSGRRERVRHRPGEALRSWTRSPLSAGREGAPGRAALTQKSLFPKIRVRTWMFLSCLSQRRYLSVFCCISASGKFMCVCVCLFVPLGVL